MLLVFYEMGQYVSLHVVHCHKRYPQGNGKRFGKGSSYKQRAKKTRTFGESYAIQVLFSDTGPFKCLIHNGNYVFLMRPRSQFGNHSAIVGMDLLAGDHIRQDQVVLQHSCTGFIAGGFNGKYVNSFFLHPTELGTKIVLLDCKCRNNFPINRLKKIAVRFFLIASFILVLLSVLFSFSGVQTALARILTDRINAKFGTSIAIEKVDLSSLRNVKLRSVLIRDHHQDTLFYVGSLETAVYNYRNILKSELDFGDILLDDGKFLLKTYAGEEPSNLSVFVEKFRSGEEEKENVFKMYSSSITARNVDFTLVNENKKSDPIVYYHDIYGIFDDFQIEGSRVSANIHGVQTTEDHGVAITDFQTRFQYTDTLMEFKETALHTENSSLYADIVFDYEEGDLSDFTNKVWIRADFKKSDIVLSDLQKLYGEFGRYDKIHFSSSVEGTLADFTMSDIELTSDRHSSLRGNIRLQNVLDQEHFRLDGDIREISSNYDHLVNLLPNLLGTRIPRALEKVGYFSSRGKVAVTRTSLRAKLRTIAELGLSNVDLQLSDIDKKDLASYKGNIELIDFKLGQFLNDSLIGELSMTGEVEGRGFTVDKMNIQVKGHVSKHQYKGYTYSNIDINGVFMDNRFDGYLAVDDPSIQLVFKGLADLSREEYQFNFNADVAYADFRKLNLFTRDEKSVLKGSIDMDFRGRTIDDMQGEISFKDASYSNQNDDYYFKDFSITSERIDSIREVKVNSTDIVTGYMKGVFKFGQLQKLGMNSLGSLFLNYEKVKVDDGQFLEFRFNIYNKIVEVFYPDLKLGANSIIRGEIDSDNDLFQLTLKSPNVEAFDFMIDNIDLQIDNKNPLYNTLLSVNKFNTKYYDLSDITLVNVMLKDTLFMEADLKGGKEETERYKFSFYHTFNENNQSVFGMNRSELFFKNKIWFINPENNDQNKVVYDTDIDTYAIDDFNMVCGGEEVHLSGLWSRKDDKNIDLRFENVNLFDVTPSIDSVILDGKVNGMVHLRSVNNKILPIADLNVNYFSINRDFYGDLSFNASSDENLRNYTFDARLLNADLETFRATGSIDFNSEQPTILANVAMDRFRLNSFSPMGKGVLTDIRGLASGDAVVSGNLGNPDIQGEIRISQGGIMLPYLNVNYDFEGETPVALYGQTFDFQRVALVDTAMRTRGELRGTIKHSNFKRWDMDLEINTDNLLVLNTRDHEGALYYGTGLMGGRTTIKGYTDELVIDVEARTNPGTEFYVPLGNVSTVNNSRLIHFESPQESEDDEIREEIVFERLKGLTLNFDLEVTREAMAQIVLDRATGSILKGSGTGDLALNIDTNGKFEMYGDLTIDNGEYQFKNIVNKDFIVLKGGTIVWDGSPYEAQVNITAVNYTKANPSVLLDEIASSRKIDVELYTYITGNLSSPNLNFDVKIPNASSMVASELDFKLRNEDDRLTQFFSVLATGAFARTEDNKTNFNSNAAIAGTVAQKASQLLSNMLESENDNFQVGVTYDIGTENSVKDVTTDDQLGVEVSGRIGDKVMVSGKVGVPVGSNTNSNVIGEVEVKVPLNAQETLQAKVYNRQNEIQFDVIEGEGYTQGVGISYRLDFSNGREFMEKIGLRKTEEEKEMTREQLDSLKQDKKELRREFRQGKEEEGTP